METMVDLEGMRRRAAEAKACASAWGETEHGSDDEGVAGAQLEAAAIKTAGDVLALCAEVERLRDRNDALHGEVVGTREHIVSVARSHTEAVRLLGEANTERDAALLKARILEDGIAEAKSEISILNDKVEVLRGSLAEQAKEYVDARAKVGVLLAEIADTAIAAGMMAPDMRDAIDGPNAIQFLQQMRDRETKRRAAEAAVAHLTY